MVADVLHFYSGAVDKHRGATIPVAGGRRSHLARAAGRGGGHRAVELPARHHLVEDRAGPGLWEHGGGEAGRAHPAHGRCGWPSSPSTPASPRACSRWWWGAAPRWASALVEHPDVAKVAFTGSTEAGRDVMARAAGTIKRVTLELGGKSANVVFADADLELAAASAPLAVFGNAGQDCCARSRILVERTRVRPLRRASRRRHRVDRRGRPRGPRHPDGPARLRRAPGAGSPASRPAEQRTSRWPVRSAVPDRARAGGSRPRCSPRSTPEHGCGARRSSVRWWR